MVVDVSGGGLSGQPFAHVTLMQSGLLRKLGRSDHGTIRHRLVESEAIAEQDACAAKRDAEVTDQLSYQRVQLFEVWFTHCSFLLFENSLIVIQKAYGDRRIASLKGFTFRRIAVGRLMSEWVRSGNV